MNKLEIIAEIAQGFEGNIVKAKLFIKSAASAGANAAKFQMVYADELATPDYKYYDLFKTLELTIEEWKILADYAKELKIKLYVDIFGEKSLKISENINSESIKIHGTDIANYNLLKQVAASNISTIILGAGGAYLIEIENALRLLKNKKVISLVGFQGYPTQIDENQIGRIAILEKFINENYPNTILGFADHSSYDFKGGLTLCSLAIGFGAKVIEKHLTLGRNIQMEDFESALNPDEFEEFVNILKKTFTAVGNSNLSNDFSMSEAEKNYRNLVRRHVITLNSVDKGELLLDSNLVLKRSSSVNAISDLQIAINKRVNINLASNVPINIENILHND